MSEKNNGFTINDYGFLEKYSGNDSSVVIPDGVTEIGDGTFDNCTTLKSVELPSSLESIGRYAFENCTSLNEICYGGTKAQWKAVEKMKDWRNDIAAAGVCCSDGIAEFETFDIVNGSLTGYNGTDSDVVIPDGVTSIDGYAFHVCTSLETVKIPTSVKAIYWNAFEHCTSLRSVVIPEDVSLIGSYAFYNCDSLKEILYDGTKAQWQSIRKGEDWHEFVPAKCVICADGTVEL